MAKTIDLEEVAALAASGMSTRQIAAALGIARSTLYKKADIVDTIKDQQQQLRLKVAKDLLKRSSSDLGSSATIFLAKRLGLYSCEYDMPQIRSIKSAVKQISRVNSDLAAGTVTSELATHLISNLTAYIRAYEVSELAESVAAIQQQLDDQKGY